MQHTFKLTSSFVLITVRSPGGVPRRCERALANAATEMPFRVRLTLRLHDEFHFLGSEVAHVVQFAQSQIAEHQPPGRVVDLSVNR